MGTFCSGSRDLEKLFALIVQRKYHRKKNRKIMKNTKKIMQKKIVFLMSMLIIHQTYGMHTPMEIEIADSIIEKKTDFKELLRNIITLPTDIKRYIFQIMPRESHDEFIERIKTTTKKTIPDYYYYKNFQKPQLGKGGRDKMNIPTAGLCPYNDYVAVLNGKHLQIINTHNHSIIHTEKLPRSNYKNIALSCNPHTIATIHKEKRDVRYSSGFSFSFASANVLTIKNIHTQKTESFDLPSHFEVAHANYQSPEFGFNKEGTDLILRGVDDQKEQTCSCDPESLCDVTCQDMPHHLIIPVTINQHMHLLFSLIMRNILPNSANEEFKEKK